MNYPIRPGFRNLEDHWNKKVNESKHQMRVIKHQLFKFVLFHREQNVVNDVNKPTNEPRNGSNPIKEGIQGLSVLVVNELVLISVSHSCLVVLLVNISIVSYQIL